MQGDSHRRVQASFSAYHDGGLRWLARRRVARHLASCESCRNLYQAFLTALHGLAELRHADPVPDSDFVTRVMRQVRATRTD